MKLGVIIVMARVLAKSLPKNGSSYSFRELIIPSVVVIVPMGLIMEQPDLGTALSLGLVGIAQILFVLSLIHISEPTCLGVSSLALVA